MRRSALSIVLLLAVLLGAALPAVGFEIRGAVLDGEGTPVGAAKAWLVQNHETRLAETDASGGFVFADAEVGLSHLVVWKEGYALGGHTGVVVGPETLTFRLGPPTDLELRVIDHAYRSVHGARVSSLVINQDIVVPVDDLASAGFPSARSDEEGFLAFPALPERCVVELRVAHRDYVEAPLPLLPVGAKVWTVQLRTGAILRGRAENEAGQGVGGGLVSVLDLANEKPGRRYETRTDPEGFYRLKVLPGAYDVGVKHPEYAAAIPHRIELDGSTEESVVDLTVLPPRYVHGHIVKPDNALAVGVWVALSIEMGLYGETVTGPDGAFRLRACPGPVTLRIFPPDGFLVREGNELPLDVNRESVRVPDIHLDPLPEVVGTVFAPRGAREPNTLISSLDIEPPIWLITDAQGQFRIQLDRAPMGKARFRAEQALRFLRSDFEVDLHDPPRQDVVLAPFEPDLAPREGQGITRGIADLVGAPAPEIHCDAWFNLERQDDGQVDPPSLKDLQGNVVVLTFWSGVDVSGTGRFRIEELRALHDLFRFSETDDVVILGVHDRMTAPEAIRQYVEQYRISFPVAKDAGSAATFERYKIRSIPRTVLIDRSGVVRYFDVGGRLLELIKGLRREPRAAP